MYFVAEELVECLVEVRWNIHMFRLFMDKIWIQLLFVLSYTLLATCINYIIGFRINIERIIITSLIFGVPILLIFKCMMRSEYKKLKLTEYRIMRILRHTHMFDKRV